MNLAKAFQYPFEDKEWPTKVGLGALITIVPILNFAILGYTLEIMRRVEKNDPQPLPGWDDLGKKLLDGLMLFLVGLVYALPVILLVGLPLAIMVIPAVLAANSGSQDLINTAATAGGFVELCLSCLFVIYGLGLSVIFPAIYIEYIHKGTFGACFNFKQIFAMIGKNAGAYFTAWGVYLGTSIGVGIVTGIVGTVLALIPCIGQLVVVVIGLASTIYVLLVFAHLFGQFGVADAPIPPATAA
jgi:hypothetical protein